MSRRRRLRRGITPKMPYPAIGAVQEHFQHHVLNNTRRLFGVSILKFKEKEDEGEERKKKKKKKKR